MRRAVLLLLLLAGPAAAEGPARWWDREYPFRKRIVLSARQAFPGAPAAHVRLPTGGRARPDGADLRVATLDGREVPRAVMAVGPGDLYEVAFPVGSDREWHVYYGNPQPKPVREEWQPDRGLVLETRERGPGDPVDWPAMQRILEGSTKVFGGSYWPQVFDAENPFGPSDDFVSEYRGFLSAPVDGLYRFFTASDEASFLLIGEKVVVQWPGWHDASKGAWATFKGEVRLAAGLHPFRYAHVERVGAQIMAAYWQPPGAEKPVVIPASAFPGLLEAEVVAHESAGKSVAADFSEVPAGKWGRDDVVYAAMTFKASGGGANARHLWNFGDGTETTGAIVTHVFLRGGDYPVTLTAMEGGETDSVTRAIRVSDEWTRFDRNDDPTLARFARIAGSYPGRALDAEDLTRLGNLLGEAGREDDFLSVLREAVDRSNRLAPDERFAFAMRLGDELRDRKLDLDGAVWAFTRAAAAAGRGKREIAARVALAEAHLLLGGNAGVAAKLLETAVVDLGEQGGDVARRAWLRLGDARMDAGDGPGARASYERAEDLAGGPENATRLLRKAAAARSAMTCIETGELFPAVEALSAWELDAPTDRYSGMHRLARARAVLAAGRPDLAVREVRPVLAANPDSEYAPAALEMLAELAEAAGDAEGAAAWRARLKKDYPWSPLAR